MYRDGLADGLPDGQTRIEAGVRILEDELQRSIQGATLAPVTGHLAPSEADHAAIDGLDCYHQSFEVHKRVSYLPGDSRLFRTMRAREVIDFFTSVRRDHSRARAEKLAYERFGLDPLRPVTAMSTGMRQKLALAVTLAIAFVVRIAVEKPALRLRRLFRRRAPKAATAEAA